MLLSNLLIIPAISALAAAHPVHELAPYSSKEAASIARTLVARESLSQFNTVQQSGSFEGWPVSFVEYYSDCNKDGNPFMLLVDMSTDYQNVALGSKLTLSIKVGDHQYKDGSNPHYPGGIVSSTMGSPRVMLTGSLINVSESYSTSEIMKISECFVKRHHDAIWWLPGSKIHSSQWWQFKVEGVYFIGGFGDRAYIGEVPVEDYLEAELIDDAEFTLKFHSNPHHGNPHHREFQNYHHKIEQQQQDQEVAEYSLGKLVDMFRSLY